jgi:hypothetical protein
MQLIMRVAEDMMALFKVLRLSNGERRFNRNMPTESYCPILANKEQI